MTAIWNNDMEITRFKGDFRTERPNCYNNAAWAWFFNGWFGESPTYPEPEKIN